jgi:hypothetical protein
LLQSQLLALFAEQTIELEQVATLAEDSLLAAGLGPGAMPVRSYGGVLRRHTERMLEEGPLLMAASPIALTELGRRTALSGLSGDSGNFVRASLARERDRIAILMEQRDIARLAIRCAWLPWEAIEQSAAYGESSRQWNSAGLVRTPDTLSDLEDARLAREYALGDSLLQPMTFSEIAESDLVQGRSPIDRLTNAIDTANSMSGILPWTLTGTVRIADLMGDDDGLFRELSSSLTPLVRQIQYWMPWQLGIDLAAGPLDRDTAIMLLRESGLGFESKEELKGWVAEHEAETNEIVGVDAWDRFERWLAR